MGEYLSVREVMKLRGIIAHGVLGSWQVVMQREVLVVTLVPCLEPKEVCWCCSGGCSAFALPVESCHVVGFGQQGLFTDVEVAGGSVQMEEAACQF